MVAKAADYASTATLFVWVFVCLVWGSLVVVDFDLVAGNFRNDQTSCWGPGIFSILNLIRFSSHGSLAITRC